MPIKSRFCVKMFGTVHIIIRGKRVLVFTAWRLLRLRMDKQPLDMMGRSSYVT